MGVLLAVLKALGAALLAAIGALFLIIDVVDDEASHSPEKRTPRVVLWILLSLPAAFVVSVFWFTLQQSLH